MTRLQSFSALVTLAVLPSVLAVGPTGDLTITSSDVAPDGFTRPAIHAGTSGTVIGELVKGNKGDSFAINVVDNLNDNRMLQATSIHWHGVLQHGTNWADGGAQVNQCPISKGHSFQYEFHEPDQAGTFWYHSHYRTQYCDGLRGPLVIYDPADPHKALYDVDDESTVITLADWYHVLAKSFTGIPPTSDSTLINGLGRFGGAGGTATELTVITVEQGKRYRMRVVSVSCDPSFLFSIDSHTNLNFIEMDSISTVPKTYDSVRVFAGQRYSFVLTADQAVDNYWIRANPTPGNAGFAGGINSAILRYVGANSSEPTTTEDHSNELKEWEMVPLESPGAPGTPTLGQADVVQNMALAFANGVFTVNGVSFDPPQVPVLLQILSGAQTAQSLLPQGSVYTLNPGNVVELTIPALAVGGPHPFHLHGHAFDIIRAAGQTTPPNFVNPPRRDVLSIGTAGQDNVTIRFKADNPGPWFLHCHIDWHLELGLAVVFAESPQEWNSTIVPPDEWDQLCPTFDAQDSDDL